MESANLNRLRWAKEALSYLKGNRGQVNAFELAFADLRRAPAGLSVSGILVRLPYRSQAASLYLWEIAEHKVYLARDEQEQTTRIEAIKPSRSNADWLIEK